MGFGVVENYCQRIKKTIGLGEFELIKDDGVIKTLRLRHSRAGGNPGRLEITRSKSALSPAFAGMTKYCLNVVFTTPS